MCSRLAIDFVSPLPPVRSGISDYNGGRLPLYQMGNNRYHQEIMKLALQRPGVVTLHDVVLHHLLIEMTLAEGRLGLYQQSLQADHGWVGEVAATARQWGELGEAAMFSLPAHRTLLRRQRGVLVHSRWAGERIVEEDPEIEVRQIPMGIPLPAPADEVAGLEFRRRIGVGAKTPLIGSMGFQTPIKRTGQVIKALGEPGMQEAHLLVAGEVSSVLDFEAIAEAAGASDRLHVVGFLEFSEFEQAIAACDLCVNLRYPTAGETSASLLRVLAVGRPAIVSDYAHSAELPDDVVVKIPLGANEVDDLAVRVGSLLADRPRLKAMSQRARSYIAEQHDPSRAAGAMVSACRELAALEPPGDREPCLSPPSTLIWREVSGALEVSGGDPPWKEGELRRLRLRLTNHGPARWLPAVEGPGGVSIDVEWRRNPRSEVLASRRVELPTELGPGASRELEVRIRRPLGGSTLEIEPRIQGVSGMAALGGPRWAVSL
jgi:glycosyltransferase involved in cell wall biosynthesis